MPTTPPAGVRITYRQQFRRCGKPACTLCAGGGQGHGPYWYATWQEGGRTRTLYLGKALPSPETAAPDSAAAAPVEAPAHEIPLRVRTLGGFAVWRDGAPLPTESWARHRAGALLKWLLAAPGQRLARDEAIELLWPHATPSGSAANLRVLLHRLRRALGEPPDTVSSAIAFDGEMLMLQPDIPAREWLDAEAFALAAKRALAGSDRAACRAALALYTGEYLPDDRYDEWALARRDQLREIQARLLMHLATLSRDAGDAEEAIGCLHAVLAVDRCHEEAALALMRLHATTGHPGAALRVYRQFAEALREELDLEPGRAAQALAATLRARRQAAPATPQPVTPNNLPEGLTSFIGRGQELAMLRALLGPGRISHGSAAMDRPSPECRLLTLVGPGGIGKTRLALALAEDVLESYPDGVWLVDLSRLPPTPTTDDPLVAQQVVAALGVREEPGRRLAATLVDHLKPRRLVLLLDNCEHVLPACAALVATLLAACPALRILATSRETLGVAGEQPWSVPALSQPDPHAGPVRLADAESVRLFLARARLQRPDLEVTADNAAAIAAICRKLDGLPLALELAAARAGVLSVEAIAVRLDESLRLLTGGPRSAPGRQRTLRATLDWSYVLLSLEEQRFFRRLGVFAAGGCTLEAAEAICGGTDAASPEPLDLLAGLVQKSLLVAEEQGQGMRYRLLETVRQYAGEQLAAGDDEPATRARHLRWYLALAEQADVELKGSRQQAWLARLETEHDNLRAALQWGRRHGEQQFGLRLAGALWRFWRARGYLSEGRDWLEIMLRSGPPDAPEARARALRGAGILAREQGDMAQAVSALEQSLAISRAADDREESAFALNSLGVVATVQGDYQRAIERFQECLALSREQGDRYGIATALNNLSNAARARGDYAQALRWQAECVAIRRDLGDTQGLAVSLGGLGNVARRQGDYAQARAWYEESLALRRQLGDTYGTATVLNNISEIYLVQGDDERAGAALAESLRLRAQIGHKEGIGDTLSNIAQVASHAGCHTLAARLLAAADAAWRHAGTALTPMAQADFDAAVASLRAARGEECFTTAWESGRAMPLADAIDAALSFLCSRRAGA